MSMYKKQLNTIILHRFPTPLGTVSCGFKADSAVVEVLGPYNQPNGYCTLTIMPNYKVESINFKLPAGDDYKEHNTASHGWLWRIEKLTDVVDPVELYCKISTQRKINYGAACGEALDAIEAYDDEWSLNIGTEDGEAMRNRGMNSDGMPERLKDQLDFHKSFTILKRTGLYTKVPHLNKGEHFHIHYLMAYGKRSAEDISTWLAVDTPKRKLENWVGVW
ncbi:hypothetical protein MUGA111182_00340 [Mucilaginibacter galii]|uniref:Uncharacterized protein n=2 Tax=Mucilaginibacter galii TaxID=2005073 RepID=A0A917MZS7_9SPHI|nr:hypothetical protein GCM10011425_03100 [Mucilaginibacter galii]